jgi:hypothetical protein
MTAYQVYCLDAAGKIGFAEWIEAKDDDQAVANARELQPDAHKCEIWKKARLVAWLNSARYFERASP